MSNRTLKHVEQKVVSPPIPTLHDIFVEARRLLTNKENWCQCTLAQTQYGHPIEWENPQAVSFCMVGALYRAEFMIRGYITHEPTEFFGQIVHDNVGEWNDELQDTLWSTAHSRVLKALDRAIVKAKKANV